MTVYVKKPVKVVAFQLKDTDDDYLPVWFQHNIQMHIVIPRNFGFSLKTNHGYADAKFGDWVILTTEGELYPCSNEVFERNYESP